MIPPTSARVAAGVGEPFFPDQLYEPEVNIRLGALYIGSLYNKFGHEVPLAAGAYNAGPRAMSRWCAQHGSASHRRVRRADRLRADARVREARRQPLREVPVPLRTHAV